VGDPNLDDFVSAYIDNILIYTLEIKKDYFSKIYLIFRKLLDVGLYLDTNKSEFTKKTIKYLEFIIYTNGKELEADLDKVEAI
jgi:hypothetical protein